MLWQYAILFCLGADHEFGMTRQGRHCYCQNCEGFAVVITELDIRLHIRFILSEMKDCLIRQLILYLFNDCLILCLFSLRLGCCYCYCCCIPVVMNKRSNKMQAELCILCWPPGLEWFGAGTDAGEKGKWTWHFQSTGCTQKEARLCTGCLYILLVQYLLKSINQSNCQLYLQLSDNNEVLFYSL